MNELTKIYEKLEAIERSQADLFSMSLLKAKDVLTVEDAALLSGKTARTIREMCSSGVLTHSKPNGRNIYIKKTDLTEFLLSNKTIGTEAIKEAAHSLLKKIS